MPTLAAIINQLKERMRDLLSEGPEREVGENATWRPQTSGIQEKMLVIEEEADLG